MSNSGETDHWQADGVPPSIVFNWLLKRWLPIALGALLGSLIGLAYHFASDERFAAHMDFSIPESPLGSASFVQRMSESFLRREVESGIAVSVNPHTGTISLVSENLGSGEARTRLAAMQNAVSALEDFLNEEAVSRYEIVQQDLRNMPDNESAYTLVNHFRTYIMAQEAGFFDPLQIGNEAVSSQKRPLFNTVVLGFIAGCGLALLAVGAGDYVAGRRKAVA